MNEQSLQILELFRELDKVGDMFQSPIPWFALPPTAIVLPLYFFFSRQVCDTAAICPFGQIAAMSRCDHGVWCQLFYGRVGFLGAISYTSQVRIDLFFAFFYHQQNGGVVVVVHFYSCVVHVCLLLVYGISRHLMQTDSINQKIFNELISSSSQIFLFENLIKWAMYFHHFALSNNSVLRGARIAQLSPICIPRGLDVRLAF